MKTKVWRHILGMLFAALFSVSIVGSLITGWDLTVASPLLLYGFSCLFSAVSAVLWYFRYGVLGNLAMAGIVIWRFWNEGALWEQLQSLANSISRHYQLVYNWPAIGKGYTDTYDFALLLMGWVTAVVVTYCICRQKTIWIAVPFVFAPLSLSLLTTDTLPDEIFLYMMLLGAAVLLITEWVRLMNPEEYASLILRTAIPTALVLGLLFCLNPQAQYENHAAELQKKAVSWIRKAQNVAMEIVETGVTGNLSLQKLNLRHVGPKSDISYAALKVTSPYTGTVYLRGRDYDVYTGLAWEATEKRTETFPSGLEPAGTLTVSTYRVHDVQYTPYYTIETIQLKGGCRENTKNHKMYSYPLTREPGSCEAPSEAYTDLPQATRAWAQELTGQIVDAAAGDAEKIRQITAYVQGSAYYDISTASMDSAYDDFAQWFLMESETGYCVHFATAAAVLLRAAGIPARYVEGYAAYCNAGENTVISNTQAHAWVEYYDSGLSAWCIVEATPAGGITAGEAIPEEETDKTEESEESTVPTETEENSEPGETDARGDTAEKQNSPGTGQENTGGQNPSGAGSTPSGGGTGSHGGGNGISDTVSEPGEPFRLPAWCRKLAVLILIAALLLYLIPLQAKIRAFIAWKAWNTGDPNTMAIARWQQVQYMAGRLKTDLPEELERLALKARFSQHTLTPEELEKFDTFRKQVMDAVNRLPFFRKYWMRWWFAML